jgi:pimeloyl-ACP methyl ester carboxylesterase
LPRLVLGLLVLVAVCYIAICIALFIYQRALIYLPPPSAAAAAESTLLLDVDGARLRVTVRRKPGRQAILYFGGNAEDVSFSQPLLARAFPDRALYLLHYRGYGGSTGKPSEATLIADALSLFDQVSREHPQITVIGRSLGSGIAVHLASVRPVARLVLVTPYDSLANMAAKLFRYFPVRWLLRDKFDSLRYAPAVAAPTLIIAAEHDEVIPRACTDNLVNHFQPGIVTFRRIANVGHNTLSASPEYLRLLAAAP